MEVEYELIEEFVKEANIHLEGIETDILSLTSSPDNVELLNEMLRSVHSIKGGAGFLKFSNIVQLTHRLESVFKKIIDKTLSVSEEVIQVLLGGIDKLKFILQDVNNTQHESIEVSLISLDKILDEKNTAIPEKTIVVQSNGSNKHEFKAPNDIFESALEPHFFSLEIDLADIDNRYHISPLELIERLSQIGTIYDSSLNLDMFDLHQKCDSNFFVNLFFTTQLSEQALRSQMGFLIKNIVSLKDNRSIEPAWDSYEDKKQLVENVKKTCDKLEDLFIELDHATDNKLEVIKKIFEGLNVLYEYLQQDNDKESTAFCFEIINLLTRFNENDNYPASDVIILFIQCIDAFRQSSEAYPEYKKFKIPDKESLSSRLKDVSYVNISKGEKIHSNSNELIPSYDRKIVVRQDLRVDLEKLDILLNLVGELTIAQAIVINHPALKRIEDEGVDKSIHHLKRVSYDLQNIAMAIRMVPLSGVLRKMTRVVHDLSTQLGKKIRLNISGEDTNIDKNIVEKISDPLIHLVRNSVDHGIEFPDERETSGKSQVGEVSIEARSEAGEVLIIVRDDGRGINKDTILEQAIEKGLCSREAINRLSQEDIYNFIFEPGFSTATKVTNVSGRGVGLDVVRSNIEQLKGRVEVHSELNEGTIFTLHLPLTLAIIDGMLVRVGDSQYTIPLLSIYESVKIYDSQVFRTPDGVNLIKTREKLVPILKLSELFNKKPSSESLSEGVMIIVRYEEKLLGLFVDEILGQQQTVVKSLSEYMKSAKSISGCTILGNGSVSLIIDVGEIIRNFYNN